MDREAIVAGMFYPENPAQVASEASLLISPVKEGTDKIAPLMLMLPHAGWIYSGRVAGMTIAQSELPEDLIILGPCHRVRGKGLGVWDKGAWNSPLGPIPVNEELATEIIESGGGFVSDYAPHEQDHCIEVLLPLLQNARADIRIVPIAVSTSDPAALIRAGDALGQLMTARKAAGKQMPTIIVSSDMSHYISHENACKQDAKALEAIIHLNPLELYAVVAENEISMCGVLPATVGLQACKALNASKAELISYATSGQVSGDMSKVVGYAGVRIY